MQSRLIPLLLLSELFLLTSAERHLFTSTAHIVQLTSAKEQLADALQRVADNETLRLQRVRQFVGSLRNSTTRDGEEAERAVDMERGMHPVEAFLMIRRMGEEWKRLLGDCGNAADSVLKSVTIGLPTTNDYDGAADALLRLQDVYDISADSIARGKLAVGSIGTAASKEPLLLSVDDCLHLASRAFNQSLGLLGMQWIRLLTSDAFHPDTLIERVSSALEILQKYVILKSESRIGSLLENYWNAANRNQTDFVNKLHLVDKQESRAVDIDNYRKLCKDGSFSRENVSSQNLVCRLSVPHPFFTLAPVKEVVLSDDPRVLVFHDVLTDSASDRLIEISRPKLQRSRTAMGYSNIRIAMTAFMTDKEDWSVERVSRRLGAVTGLSIAYAESLQMGNYGIGGQYEPHMDSLGSGLKGGINRVATALVYLNDVKQGGGTVFPRLGLRVLPVKNSVLFWYNLRRSASEIKSTIHAACPVLEGSKWVANKWIRYSGQMHHRPCGLEQSI